MHFTLCCVGSFRTRWILSHFLWSLHFSTWSLYGWIVPDIPPPAVFQRLSSLKELLVVLLSKQNPQEVHSRSEAVRIVLLVYSYSPWNAKKPPGLMAVRSCLLSLRSSLKNVCRSNKHDDYLTVHFSRTLTNHYRHRNQTLIFLLNCFLSIWVSQIILRLQIFYKCCFIVNIELGLVYDAMSHFDVFAKQSFLCM